MFGTKVDLGRICGHYILEAGLLWFCKEKLLTERRYENKSGEKDEVFLSYWLQNILEWKETRLCHPLLSSGSVFSSSLALKHLLFLDRTLSQRANNFITWKCQTIPGPEPEHRTSSTRQPPITSLDKTFPVNTAEVKKRGMTLCVV